SHESPPIKFSVTEEQINRLEDKYSFMRAEDIWTPQDVTIPVNKELLRGVDQDPEQSKQWFGLDSSSPLAPNAALPTYADMGFDIPVDSLDSTVTWYYRGNYLGPYQGRDIYF